MTLRHESWLVHIFDTDALICDMLSLNSYLESSIINESEGDIYAAGSSGAERLSLEPKANPAAAEILAQPIQDTEQTLLGSINMTLLLRSVSPHALPSVKALALLALTAAS